MTDEADKPTSPEPEEMNSLLGGLDLTPEWARGTPGIQSRAPERRERDDRQGGGPRAPSDSARRGLQGVRVKPRREGPPSRDERGAPGGGGHGAGGQGGGYDRGAPSEGGYRPRQDRAPLPPRLPVHVDFIPEKTTLSKVVKIIRQSHRVYALDQVARMFMDKPASLAVKYTLREQSPDAAEFWFYQCTANGMVFSSREACAAYVVERGLAAYYESETREVAAPTGNFPCIGRHRPTGRLIGPPNWHGYQRRLEDLRQEVAPGSMPEHFSAQVEMVHEAEVIEAWKKELSIQTFWRRKTEALPSAPVVEEDAPEASEAPSEVAAPEAAAPEGEAPLPEAPEAPVPEALPFSLTRDQAEAEFKEKVVPSLIHKARRAIMPGALVPAMADEAIASLTRYHLEREHRQPGSIIFALRPAFKHMRLYIFRHDSGLMVSGVEPHPLPSDQKVIPEIQGIIDYVAANPGRNAKETLLAVHSTTGEPTPEMVSHFRWLIEKGHLLEFADGSLQLPHARGQN